MVCGLVLSESFVRRRIKEGNFATDIHSAFLKFGTDFVQVSPIPDGLDLLISLKQAKSQESRWLPEDNICYVLKPEF